MTEIPEHLRRRAEAARVGSHLPPPMPSLTADIARMVAKEIGSDPDDGEDQRMIALSMALVLATGRSKSATEVVGDAEEFHAYLFPAATEETR